MNKRIVIFLTFLLTGTVLAQNFSPEQLEKWRQRFPDADTNKDGTLTLEEGLAYVQKMRGGKGGGGKGAPRQFKVDPAWENSDFPDYAVSKKSPESIRAIYQEVIGEGKPAVVSYEKPTDGALRIVGTGHSFMGPGYRTFPAIAKAAGMDQPLYTHTGGGMTGSTRYKWEEENGIFQFDKKPEPKLLASISNAEWDAMMWGPYFADRPQYYSCWIDFCLKYNPDMKFYLSDAWIQLYQLEEDPDSEDFFTEEVLDRLNEERQGGYRDLVDTLNEKYPGKVYIMPTAEAMTRAAKHFVRGELPQIEGIHRVIGGKERSLWRDRLGHLGPGFDRLEGYVFYATLYGKSPELITETIDFGGDPDFPGPELDQVFRKIAWEAVVNHPLSGIKDKDGDGIADTEYPPTEETSSSSE